MSDHVPGDNGWDGWVIDGTTGNNHRHWPRLEYTRAGEPRVAQVHCGDGLYYRERPGGPGTPWTEEPVESTGVSMCCDLALDGDDLPWISYSGQGALKCAWKDCNSQWNYETVETGSFWDTSICISPVDCQPRISYLDSANGALKYAYRVDTANWVVETVDTRTGQSGAAGWDNSIAINPVTNEVGISYGYTFDGHMNPGYLRYAWKDPGTPFRIMNASPAWILATSLAFDAGGNPCIAYHQHYEATPAIDNLAYIKLLQEAPAGNWLESEQVFPTDASDGYSTSVALSNSGFPRVSSSDQTNKRVLFTWLDPIGRWLTVNVASAMVSDQTAIATYQAGSTDVTGICFTRSEAGNTWSVVLMERDHKFN